MARKSKVAVSAEEAMAFAALKRALADGRVLAFTDPRVVNKPHSPAYSPTDVYAPPLVLFGASVTLLISFGVLQWIAAMMCVTFLWAFVQPPIVRWRAKLRARRIAFATPEGLKLMWSIGGMAVMLKDWPDRICVAPKGDWRAFSIDYLVDLDEARQHALSSGR
jgi:hypothetical protein